MLLGGIQDLVRGGLDKRIIQEVLFSQEIVWSKYLHLFHFRGFDRATQTPPGFAPVLVKDGGAGGLGMGSKGRNVALSFLRLCPSA